MRKTVFTLLVVLLLSLTVSCSLIARRTHLPYQITLQLTNSDVGQQNSIATTISVLERRLDSAGIKPFKIASQGAVSNEIKIQLPSSEVGQRVRALLTNLGKLELLEVVSPLNPAPVQLYKTRADADASIKSNPNNVRVLPYASAEQGDWAVVNRDAIISGDDIRQAGAVNRTGRNNDY